MSDRASMLVVFLDHDTRSEDDLKPLMEAIMQLRGVIDVRPNVSNITDQQVGAMRERIRLSEAIRDAFAKTV